MQIDFNGIDNSGKTSLIKKLEDIIDIDVYIPSNIIKEGTLFPKTLEERKKWYVTASISEILKAFNEGYSNRQDKISFHEEKIILVDRGRETIYSSCIARTVIRESIKIEEAKKIVTYYCPNLLIPVSSIKIHLYFPGTFINTLKLIKEREGNSFEQDFLDYLKVFQELLTENFIRKSHLAINCMYDLDINCNLILEKLKW